MNSQVVSRARVWITITMGVILIGIMFLPYAMNGMWFDDALNSQTWGMVNRFHTTVWDFAMMVSKKWLTNFGRILFSWPWVYGFFYVLRDVRVIRLADILLVTANIALVMYLLRRLRVSWATIGLFVLFLVVFFQIRDSDDPVGAYASFCQILGICLTLSLILLLRWRETLADGYLILSILVAFASILCYELNIIYVPIALIAVATSGHRHRWRIASFVLVPLLVFLAASYYVKHGASLAYDGSSFGKWVAILPTYMKQLAATFPGSYYLFEGHNSFPVSELFPLMLENKMVWLVAALSLLVFLSCVHAQRAQQTAGCGAMLMAAALVLVPPLLIAISLKYQGQLTWGNAHIVVYYQQFGLALFVALLMERFVSNKPSIIYAYSFFFAVYAGANWVVNIRQSTKLDAVFAEPRATLVASLEAGLFNDVQDGDIVEIIDQPIFINGNLIYQTIQKNVSIPNEEAVKWWFESKPRANALHYRLRREDVAHGNAWRLDKVSNQGFLTRNE